MTAFMATLQEHAIELKELFATLDQSLERKNSKRFEHISDRNDVPLSFSK